MMYSSCRSDRRVWFSAMRKHLADVIKHAQSVMRQDGDIDSRVIVLKLDSLMTSIAGRVRVKTKLYQHTERLSNLLPDLDIILPLWQRIDNNSDSDSS